MVRTPGQEGIRQEVEDTPQAWGFLGAFPTPSLYSPCPNLPSFWGFLRGSTESLMGAQGLCILVFLGWEAGNSHGVGDRGLG